MPNHFNLINKRIQRYLLLTLLILSACDKTSNEYLSWEIYRGDQGSTSYSSLDQINKDNIDRLEVAWEYATGDVAEGSRSTMQCNPIVVDGKMYVTSPLLKLICLNAITGEELWRFDPFEGTNAGGRNRGVTFWKDKKDKRIFLGAGSFLYCLNADNGSIIDEFGTEGKIDLREGLGRDPSKLFVRITTPGIIYEDLLIQGTMVLESYGAAPGFVRAYDVKTGENVWTFHTIPQPGEFGYDTWEEDNHVVVGGVNSWAGFALDEKRGIVYVPTGAASFDLFGGDRKGENLFANCLLALNAKTGERIWHYQLVHHDIWDYDLPAPPTLITVNKDGKKIDAVAQITKMGWVFVFDRDTGEPVWPIEERPVPQSDLLGELSWPTQPYPLKPPAFVRQVFDDSQITDLSPESNQYIKDFLKNSNYGPIYTSHSVDGMVLFPGAWGGGEWGGPAFDPESGILYVNANEVPLYITLKPIGLGQDKELSGKSLYQLNNCSTCHGADLNGFGAFPSLKQISISKENVMTLFETGKGQMPAFPNLTQEQKEALIDYLFNQEKYKDVEAIDNENVRYVQGERKILKDQDGYFGVKPPWGTLNAIDMNKGEILWKVPLGIYPELIERGLPPTGTQNLGGAVVTKGGLVFIAATRDEMFRAFDKETGEIMWEHKLPFSGYATPSTYKIDGVQYVVIAAGGHYNIGGKTGDRYIAFKLKGH